MADKKITFLFGAGAEACFGMPLGAQYTLETILSKRSKMLDVLEDFYSGKLGNYATKYSKRPLFIKTSHTFRDIIRRACDDIDIRSDDLDYASKQVAECACYNEEDETAKKAFYKQACEVHNFVYIDLDSATNNNIRPRQLPDISTSNKYSSLMHHFSYYGTVEKDFSSIIDPQKAGKNCFWRLINYFWSAFFSIVFPILNLSSKYRSYMKDKNCEKKYKYILDNLNEVIGYIYSEEYFKEEISKNYSDNYYCKLSEVFPNSNAVTTNYTPFVKFYYQSPIYLAGKLSQFEIPNELRVVDLSSGDTYADIADKMIFPFMLTQAPIKPIIDKLQLTEYSNFMRALDETKTLVIVGYGINENDNHINALIRDYLVKNNDNRLVFVKHNKDDRKATEKLRISEPAIKQRITVIPCDGTADDIDNLIKKLKEIK